MKQQNSLRIGVFDSGLGGLTIVRAITKLIPNSEIFYIADTANAPYGEKSYEQIREYSLKITKYFVDNYSIDALVVACNTATSASITLLRENYPNLTIVGTEPGVKPALKVTKSKKIGVMATPATLAGQKYQSLVDRLCTDKEIKLFEQACPGLVEQIEAGEVLSNKTLAMLEEWLAPMKEAGVDTIVLGCTHYPIASEAIKRVMKRDLKLIETGEAIARRLITLLGDYIESNGSGDIHIFATGKIDKKAVEQILGKSIKVHRLEYL